MTITAEYTNQEHTTFKRSDMPGAAIPAVGGNRHYRELIELGVTIADYVAPSPTVDDVVAERNRRLQSGFSYDFGDSRGIHLFATTDSDMKGWDDVTKGATAAVIGGAGSTEFNISTETGDVTVTAAEWQQILIAATLFRQPIWAASFVLQAMSPIPANYTDDSYWT